MNDETDIHLEIDQDNRVVAVKSNHTTRRDTMAKNTNFTLIMLPDLVRLLHACRHAETSEDQRAAHEALGQYVAKVHREQEDMN